MTGKRRGGQRARPAALGEVRPLVVDELDVRYGAVTAVDGLSFDVRGGSVVGLLGPNGCGKTSTLRAIVGVLRPASGRVVVNGVEQPSVAARSQLAYVPDEPDGLDELAMSEYLALVRGLYRADAGFDARGAVLADAFGIASRRRSRVGALSHGQRRLVSMTAAFALSRALVVVDEATAALDPSASIALREVVRALAGRGAGVLVATQELSFAERVCDEVVFLDGGVEVASGSVARLAPLEESYLSAVGARRGADEVRRGLDAL